MFLNYIYYLVQRQKNQKKKLVDYLQLSHRTPDAANTNTPPTKQFLGGGGDKKVKK